MSDTQIVKIEGGSITSTPGFQAAGVACGIKGEGALDLAVVYSDQPCAGAAVFTTNAFKAAPVLYDRRVVRTNPTGLRGVVINSGCANACTGDQGLRDSETTAAAAAVGLGVAAGDMLVMSTGVIGALLPMDKILAGVQDGVTSLKAGVQAGHTAARAIMTTDTRPKESAVRVTTPGGDYVIAGMVKGAGMIHPNMATMLSVITTSATIAPELADTALRQAADVSFHCMTVDGDTSTNDTVLVLANGTSSAPPIDDTASDAFGTFVEALTVVATDLAKAVARDGEGANHFVEITVKGGRTAEEARTVAKSVANSLLVKTAVFGQDANWGRIVCAAGYSGVEIDPSQVSVWLDELELFRKGAPYDVNEERASEILAEVDIPITVDLGAGQAEVTVWTCDIGHGYIDSNASYRT